MNHVELPVLAAQRGKLELAHREPGESPALSSKTNLRNRIKGHRKVMKAEPVDSPRHARAAQMVEALTEELRALPAEPTVRKPKTRPIMPYTSDKLHPLSVTMERLRPKINAHIRRTEDALHRHELLTGLVELERCIARATAS